MPYSFQIFSLLYAVFCLVHSSVAFPPAPMLRDQMQLNSTRLSTSPIHCASRFGLGGKLNADSCNEALGSIDKDGTVNVYYRGRGIPSGVKLPLRYVSRESLPLSVGYTPFPRVY